MRRWLAALALVPAVAWGQDFAKQECMSAGAREAMIRNAMSIADAKERGMAERELLELALEQEGVAFRAAFLAGIDHVYSTDLSASSVADAMQIECYNAASR